MTEVGERWTRRWTFPTVEDPCRPAEPSDSTDSVAVGPVLY